MTPEEELLTELLKLHSQVYENQEEIKQAQIEFIKKYGSIKYSIGYTFGLAAGGNDQAYKAK